MQSLLLINCKRRNRTVCCNRSDSVKNNCQVFSDANPETSGTRSTSSRAIAFQGFFVFIFYASVVCFETFHFLSNRGIKVLQVPATENAVHVVFDKI